MTGHSDWNTRMWMILHDPGPQRAESTEGTELTWKPICSRRLILSRPSGEKREETAQRQFLSRPSAQPGQICVIWEWKWAYMGHQVHDVWWTRDMSKHPPPSPSCSSPALSPPRCHSPRSPSYSPPRSFPSRESSVEPQLRGTPHLKAGKRHQSEPAFHLTPRRWPKDLTHGLSALLAEMSPLAPYRLQWQAKVKAQEKINHP